MSCHGACPFRIMSRPLQKIEGQLLSCLEGVGEGGGGGGMVCFSVVSG